MTSALRRNRSTAEKQYGEAAPVLVYRRYSILFSIDMDTSTPLTSSSTLSLPLSSLNTTRSASFTSFTPCSSSSPSRSASSTCRHIFHIQYTSPVIEIDLNQNTYPSSKWKSAASKLLNTKPSSDHFLAYPHNALRCSLRCAISIKSRRSELVRLSDTIPLATVAAPSGGSSWLAQPPTICRLSC